MSKESFQLPVSLRSYQRVLVSVAVGPTANENLVEASAQAADEAGLSAGITHFARRLPDRRSIVPAPELMALWLLNRPRQAAVVQGGRVSHY